jgi:RNA polymerase sigma factor (sigma-70 family)
MSQYDFKERDGMSGVEKGIPKASGKSRTEVRQRVGLAAEVFGKYGDEILAVIRFNVDDQSKAHDIFQDFFVSLVRKPIPSHIEDVRGYLYKAVTNDVIDVFRQTKNRQNNAQKYAYVHKHNISQDDPQDIVIHAEETERMLRLIENHLPNREATVLLRRCSDGFSTADTAEKLHLTKRTVSRYLSVAMKKIRRFKSKSDGIIE